MKGRRSRIWALGLAIAIAVSAAALRAQPAATGDRETRTYSEAGLEKYAAAVAAIQQHYRESVSQIRAAETPEQKKELRQRSRREIKEIIESNGLTLEKYNQISQDARNDAGLFERIREHMK